MQQRVCTSRIDVINQTRWQRADRHLKFASSSTKNLYEGRSTDNDRARSGQAVIVMNPLLSLLLSFSLLRAQTLITRITIQSINIDNTSS